MPKVKELYKTRFGTCYLGYIEDALKTKRFKNLTGKVDLILTSPPFPLKRKKSYGNLNGEKYLEWLTLLAREFRQLLTPRGSIVVELGNAWEPRRPVMSTVPLKALLRFLEGGRLNLCQQFVWFNNARLPGPAQWVNIERIRVKDAFTHIWWMSRASRPKASNRRVLISYSESMKQLLRTQRYNAGLRPSEHLIGKASFLKRNKGAIPPNVLVGANTTTDSGYLDYCRKRDYGVHPARMPAFVAKFFIQLLTQPGDTVLDPFGGSNTTGATAERLKRRWVTVEADADYARGSYGRFVGRRGG
jgi:DNA modification methylase